jgi:site-specific DNA-methyltransferase (adenine-specific)
MNIGGYEISGIYCKDTIDGMRTLPDCCVDLIVTDPPYLTGYKTHRRADKEHEFARAIRNDDNPELIREYFAECYRISKPDTALYSFCDIDKIDVFKEFIRNGGYIIRNVIAWVKNDHTAGDLYSAFGQKYECIIYANKGRAIIRGKRYSDVWEFPKVPAARLIHQNQKPVELLMRAIEAHSDVGGIVFDGFAGSGSTCIAARYLRRKYLAFEIDEKKYDDAVKRIDEEFTKQTGGRK